MPSVKRNPWRDKIETEWYTLYLGDCLEILPVVSAEITVTSPPYNTLPQKNKPSGLHAQRKNGVNQWMSKAVNSYFDFRPEDEYQEWLRSIVSLCLARCSGLVWVNHKIRYRDGEAVHPVRFLPYPIYSEVIWDRKGSMALNCKRYAPSTEHLLGFGKPHTWNDELNSLMSVWPLHFDMEDTGHPCAFPIEIASRPIQSSTRVGERVLDPFMGSGTTGIACVYSGRKFIGIEIDSAYFTIASKRIQDACDEVDAYRETESYRIRKAAGLPTRFP